MSASAASPEMSAIVTDGLRFCARGRPEALAERLGVRLASIGRGCGEGTHAPASPSCS